MVSPTRPRSKPAPWWTILAELIEHLPDLTHTELETALVLIQHGDRRSGTSTPWESWPSVERIAEKTRRNRRTIQRALRGLEEVGFIEPVTDGGGRHTTRYRIIINDSRGGTHAAPEKKKEGRHPRRPNDDGNDGDERRDEHGGSSSSPLRSSSVDEDDWVEYIDRDGCLRVEPREGEGSLPTRRRRHGSPEGTPADGHCPEGDGEIAHMMEKLFDRLKVAKRLRGTSKMHIYMLAEALRSGQSPAALYTSFAKNPKKFDMPDDTRQEAEEVIIEECYG